MEKNTPRTAVPRSGLTLPLWKFEDATSWGVAHESGKERDLRQKVLRLTK
jgi:hypothetical protein